MDTLYNFCNFYIGNYIVLDLLSYKYNAVIVLCSWSILHLFSKKATVALGIFLQLLFKDS